MAATTVMTLVVSVPVLSEQMVVALPMVSHAAMRRTWEHNMHAAWVWSRSKGGGEGGCLVFRSHGRSPNKQRSAQRQCSKKFTLHLRVQSCNAARGARRRAERAFIPGSCP